MGAHLDGQPIEAREQVFWGCRHGAQLSVCRPVEASRTANPQFTRNEACNACRDKYDPAPESREMSGRNSAVECDLAKVEVGSSNLLARSNPPNSSRLPCPAANGRRLGVCPARCLSIPEPASAADFPPLSRNPRKSLFRGNPNGEFPIPWRRFLMRRLRTKNGGILRFSGLGKTLISGPEPS